MDGWVGHTGLSHRKVLFVSDAKPMVVSIEGSIFKFATQPVFALKAVH